MTATPRALQLARVAALAAEDKIAQDVMAIDVSQQLALTDVFVIASASNERQVGAIVDEIEDKLREVGVKPIRREGAREGRRALIDFGDIIVHVQHEEEREYYALERLWKDCPEIDLATVAVPARPGADDAEAVDAADEGLREHRDPREAVLAAYAAMARHLSSGLEQRGQEARRSDTAGELLEHAVGAGLVSRPPARTLTDLFREARYSQHPMGEESRTSASQCLAQVRDELAAHRA